MAIAIFYLFIFCTEFFPLAPCSWHQFSRMLYVEWMIKKNNNNNKIEIGFFCRHPPLSHTYTHTLIISIYRNIGGGNKIDPMVYPIQTSNTYTHIKTCWDQPSNFGCCSVIGNHHCHDHHPYHYHHDEFWQNETFDSISNQNGQGKGNRKKNPKSRSSSSLLIWFLIHKSNLFHIQIHTHTHTHT